MSLYENDYNVLLKKIKQDLNQWRCRRCPQSGKYSYLKMSVLVKLLQKCGALAICNPTETG